jgi:hypothetical protein
MSTPWQLRSDEILTCYASEDWWDFHGACDSSLRLAVSSVSLNCKVRPAGGIRVHLFNFAVAPWIEGQIIACATMISLPLNVTAGEP